ncbi:UNVERIFIED_CONTAM: hypothetical protein FKN15_047831 [Acipenser sinensis]
MGERKKKKERKESGIHKHKITTTSPLVTSSPISTATRSICEADHQHAQNSVE